MTQASKERQRIADVLEREEVVEAIAGFAADNRRTVLLIANLLRTTDLDADPERPLSGVKRALADPATAEADPDEEVVVSWSGKRHYRLPGGRTLHDGSARARCNDMTYGKPADVEGVVRWGVKSGSSAASLPLCKSCIRSASK